ncbi:MAG TPA: 5'-deoxyadenosine deaminase [Vicinamibacterales bacterium]|nr:5'-deoxyadenosine deaminase [Vicinamibacterales bacterium]
MNDAFDVVSGDVLIIDGRIAAVGQSTNSQVTQLPNSTVDARGGYVLPGFIQTHVHLCQTLFRGYADDLPLMDWLRTRVWLMEAAHTPASLRAATRLATTELLLTGTTSVLTMETVHDTDAVFEAAAASGIRATIGKCMMDAPAEGTPARLHENARASLAESRGLLERWHGAANGRLHAAFAPRFAVSCTRDLLEAVADLSAATETLVHTHASENREEIAIVRALSGLANVEYLAAVRLASPRLCAAHCVWVGDREQALLAEHDVKVMHCPSSNLKLGSGLAPVAELRSRGVTVSLGADGAACNNRLDMFEEMRLAALLQATRRSPGAVTARDALTMATRAGAKTLGMEAELGSIEAGKRGDVIVVDRDRLTLAPDVDPYSTLVYAARGTDVRTTIVGGEVLIDEFVPVRVDAAAVAAEARAQARALAARAAV